MVNVDQPELRAIAERMRMLVETSLIFLDPDNRRIEETACVTVSLGGALVRRGEGLDSLLERADRCLYRSKARGRNRVMIDGDGD